MQSEAPIYVSSEHEKIFERTSHIPGWQLPGDSLKLYEIAYEKGDVILEIGTYGGRSATVELLGSLANPQRTKKPQFFGVEIDVHGVWRSYSSLKSEGLEKYALLFHGDLQGFANAIPVKPTMVFVDGDHRYEGIKRDLAILSEILSPGTPVLCHDYTNPENDSGELGVRQAVNEFVADGFATFEGTFGCSAFLITTEKCHAKSQIEWSYQEFLEQKVIQLESHGQGLYFQWATREAEQADKIELTSCSHTQLAAQCQAEQESVHLDGDLLEAQVKPESQVQLLNSEDIFEERKALERQLRIARSQIEAMKTSKFWRMRELWIKLKRLVGIPTDEIV